jgi:outer membrane immunogenic protein
MEHTTFLPGLVTAALLAAALGAQAADLPAAPQTGTVASAAGASLYDWTGFYVGAQVGYGWGQSSGTQNGGGTFFPVVPYSIDPAGGLAGGHVGLNYQIGTLVLGAEAELEVANLNGSTAFPAFNQTYFFNAKADTLASIRGRLGWAYDRLMLYGTGGVAWGNVTTPPLDGLNGWRAGWTAGAGAEYALPRNWSVKVEYRYSDLGRASSFDPNLNSTDDNKLNFHAIRLGASYRFNARP